MPFRPPRRSCRARSSSSTGTGPRSITRSPMCECRGGERMPITRAASRWSDDTNRPHEPAVLDTVAIARRRAAGAHAAPAPPSCSGTSRTCPSVRSPPRWGADRARSSHCCRAASRSRRDHSMTEVETKLRRGLDAFAAGDGRSRITASGRLHQAARTPREAAPDVGQSLRWRSWSARA